MRSGEAAQAPEGPECPETPHGNLSIDVWMYMARVVQKGGGCAGWCAVYIYLFPGTWVWGLGVFGFGIFGSFRGEFRGSEAQNRREF